MCSVAVGVLDVFVFRGVPALGSAVGLFQVDCLGNVRAVENVSESSGSASIYRSAARPSQSRVAVVWGFIGLGGTSVRKIFLSDIQVAAGYRGGGGGPR